MYDVESFYMLIHDGVSDMHCMSDVYLAEELGRNMRRSLWDQTP